MPHKNKRRPATGKSAAAAKKRVKKTRAAAAIDTKSASAPAAVLDSQKLQELYFTMLKCRVLSDTARKHAAHAARADAASRREAVLVGAAAHALPEDPIIAAEDNLLTKFIQGTPLAPLLAREPWKDGVPAANTAGLSAHPALEQGMARAAEVKGEKKAVLVFCAEDAAAFQQDALSQAARQKLPLVCLIEISSAALDAAQDQRSAAAHAQNPGTHFPQIPVDGGDVVAVFRVAQEAVRRARGGHGPSLIQCVMPERKGHARDGKHDPLTFMERYLRRRKLWSSGQQKKILDDFQRELGMALGPG